MMVKADLLRIIIYILTPQFRDDLINAQSTQNRVLFHFFMIFVGQFIFLIDQSWRHYVFPDVMQCRRFRNIGNITPQLRFQHTDDPCMTEHDLDKIPEVGTVGGLLFLGGVLS